jgi:hypothetical protein
MYWVVDALDIPWVELSPEASSGFGVSMELLSSLSEVVISSYALIHFCSNFSRECGGFLVKY